ncbi:MAG: tripartite tricarboxylate transporter substrate binding protein [Pseudomonadota bacterium]|nr:tripartite tricarboxylate transporter substrate binding protein [Pseudomonadota bacterium]MDQ2763835.1 tripartite tricarboxylate transporter substrate binding protein [Pseudomonadota bacterium]
MDYILKFRAAYPTVILSAICLLFSATAVHAQTPGEYPSRAVKIIVPFPAGGTLDNVSRLVAKGLSEKWGQSVIIYNKPGGAAVIGTEAAAQSAPDGYTLLFMANGFVIVPMMMRKVPYDPLKDFVPISLIARVNQVLVAPPTFKADDLKQLTAAAKKAPNTISFASFGLGTSSHLAMELFKKEAGIELIHVPYKGVAPALQDTLGGQVDMFFTNFPEVIGYLQSGKLKALAVADTKRLPQLPNIPTFAEQGYKDFNVYSWYGAVAPAGTPDAIVQKISSTIAQVVKELDQTKQVKDWGVVMVGSTPAELGRHMRSEQDRYAEVIRASGATLD